jgi:hypothetical protein
MDAANDLLNEASQEWPPTRCFGEIGPHAAKHYVGQDGFTQFVLNREGKDFLEAKDL